MGDKLCPKIILEGTRLTGKTDLAFALNEHPQLVGPRKYRYHSPLISAEWCTFTNFPWGRGLINFEAHEENQAMETYRTWLKLFQLQRYYSWMIDRFHLSTQLYQREVFGRIYDFGWLEEGLQELGFHLVLCIRSHDSFEAARDERLKISGNPSQYDNLDVFRREQDHFIELATQSKLPVLKLDVSTASIDDLAGKVGDWMSSMGGLYAD
ncbi:MAG: hypothetical protein HOD43_09800 [Candidatus Marinimicrobia bacterium]|nr:hypothetical protein [Candidatus Neomarinimicrobiota bacterium]MBT3631182.1 hypothetical protein [Candidatus Neomarinimicrobiota bacterium]MBT3824690.1 hypothetical protein [Candidatus Neomarinimicrobiota bacterium]MBT4131614.1 hypothetical protein [Candidatus Neomarinimicrobiota bacterium]MBT4296083.1 hypothetical protein [Candidatus Neomarinimicrobiota bacterium]